jgi:hypothetical protein
MIPTRPTDSISDSEIDALDEAIRYSLVEVVEEFVPPVAQGIHKLAQVLVTCVLRSPQLCFQETNRSGTILKPFADGAELFLEQIENPKGWRRFQGCYQLLFFVRIQVIAVFLDDLTSGLTETRNRTFEM